MAYPLVAWWGNGTAAKSALLKVARWVARREHSTAAGWDELRAVSKVYRWVEPWVRLTADCWAALRECLSVVKWVGNLVAMTVEHSGSL